MERFWVPHHDLTFAPCWLKGSTAEGSSFADEEGKVMVIPAKEAATFPKVYDAQLTGVDNICTLEEVNQAAVLHTVRARFFRSTIYTRVARIMIAVNPFRAMPLYTSQYQDRYLKAADSMDEEPHVYAVGQDAVVNLRKGEQNQAVLISGESGAGKTESTKLVLGYMAEALGGGQGGIQDKIMRTNPVLEAFGNAMTVRNNNSSRFGKWLEIAVDRSLDILGCSVTDYLLELTRVCSQGEKERNYHIFFQLLQAKNQLSSFKMLPPEEYKYLKGGTLVAPGVDDAQCYEELREAFTTLGYTPEVQNEIIRVVLGILWLGNTEFEEQGDAARIVNEDAVNTAADLLGVPSNELSKPLVIRRIAVGKEITEAKRTMAQAKAACDGMNRLMYGKLFKWLIVKINQNLSGHNKVAPLFFGVLDIAGFESFEVNSLEQLFINLSNEHLQQHFNNHIFKSELEDYKAEGITVSADLTYQDNSEIVNLLDSKGGLLSMLDEEVSVPKASDTNYANKIIKAHEKNAKFIKPKFGTDSFGVRHFAGDVTYTVEGFLEKNIDKPPDEAPSLFQSSSLSVLRDIGKVCADELAEMSGGGGRGKKVKTVSSGFRTSLSALISKLTKAEPHFIRCVKPNPQKVPDVFNSKLVMEQLVCSGVMEAISIRQKGYSSRVVFKDFWGRFRMVLSRKAQKKLQSEHKAEPALMKAFIPQVTTALAAVGENIEPSDIMIGKTKVFLKTKVVTALDKSRSLAITCYAVDIQRVWRAHRCRKQIKACKVVFDQLTEWAARNRFYSQPGSQHTALAKLETPESIEKEVTKANEIMKLAEKLPLPVPNAAKVKQMVHHMENEAKTARLLHTLLTSMDMMEMEKALARAKELELPQTKDLEATTSRLRRLKKQIPLVKAMENAIELEDQKSLTDVMSEIRKEELHMRPEEWITEIGGMELAGRIHDCLEKLKTKAKTDDIERRRKEDLQRKLKNETETEEAKKEKEEQAATGKEPTEKFPQPEETEPPPEVAPMLSAKKRKTITGFSAKEQEKLLSRILTTAEEYDVDQLEETIAEATAQGVPEADFEKGQKVFNDMQTEAFLIKVIGEVRAELGEDAAPTNLRKLQNLVNQAVKIGVSEELITETKKDLQSSVRHRARKTIHGHVFEAVNTEEMQLVEGAFNELKNFPDLKTPETWKGHRAGWMLGSGDKGPAVMLTHHVHDIREALTKISPQHEQLAVQTFRNILGWMSDRPVPECQRLGYAQDVVEVAEQRGLTDEVYMQVMKQLRENPSRRSRLLGWKLMLMLCQQVRPSDSLDEFVRAFLMQAVNDKNVDRIEEVASVARRCVADLNILQVDDNPELGEDTVPVQILLIDDSTRKLHVKLNSTLAQIADQVASMLRIHHSKDFAFFQLSEGLASHRLLAKSYAIGKVIEKWKKLKETTGRASRLLYKRRFLRVDETLNAGDLMHATLSYRQALWDYIHYPISEDTAFLCHIAGTIMCVERDHFLTYVKDGKLADPGVLEQVLPESVLPQKKRAKWAAEVTEVFKVQENVLDPHETRLLKMSRVMSLLQRMKLFGAYYWLGRQCESVPSDKVSIPTAPKLLCKINPKVPDAEYWVCVGSFGVRFVSIDSTPGNTFQRSFMYNEEAVERVLWWGAKQDVVQLVVQTVNPLEPAAGCVPMCIVLTSPAAVDIAFCIHTIYNESKDGHAAQRSIKPDAMKARFSVKKTGSH